VWIGKWLANCIQQVGMAVQCSGQELYTRTKMNIPNSDWSEIQLLIEMTRFKTKTSVFAKTR